MYRVYDKRICSIDWEKEVYFMFFDRLGHCTHYIVYTIHYTEIH